ncbi:N-acetyltransferase [Agromyces atrinae]|uniref:GNAT family N-acetyltransferase n=1 Tax=Agromyces atrinae TaxID=592376 RepID=UPI001F5A12A2|nr:GNAT family N-acetyltransferase [Agromyces atrinae]MCI2958863.1 N-acetyltransferase [Agromyces atrinae]
MSKRFAHEPDASRFAYYDDETLLSTLDYVEREGAISLTRAFTSPPQRGNGYAGDLVGWAVGQIESSSSRRIVPMCWYVGAWFDDHPEKAALLSR